MVNVSDDVSFPNTELKKKVWRKQTRIHGRHVSVAHSSFFYQNGDGKVLLLGIARCAHT